MAPLDHDGLSASSTRLRLPLAVRAATAVAILSLAAAGWQLRRADLFNDPQILVRAVGEHVFYGMALFLLVYWVAAVAAIPTLPLNLAAGWLDRSEEHTSELQSLRHL